MIAVIFELIPKHKRDKDYFDTAETLKPLLQDVDGFETVERFQSLSNPTKYLSLSFWRDEKAVAKWRNAQEHRQAQQLGRTEIFESYRLRVATVVRDYGLVNRAEVPENSY